MLKRYVFVALLTAFSAYSMEKEAAEPEYVEDARQLCQEKGLYFSKLPKDILGIVQCYRLVELLGRDIEKALSNGYEEALKNIAHLAQAAEYAQLFNNAHYVDGIIQKISNKWVKTPEEIARDINTQGTTLWLMHIRPHQLKLFEAARARDLCAVQQLIAAGVNVNAQTYGSTALMLAALSGHTEIVKMLIGAMADVNASSYDGTTIVMHAAYKGYTEIVKELIAAGADVNDQNVDGWTALISAAYNQHTEVVSMLIEAAANVNARTKRGKTALDIAREYDYKEIIKLLEKATKK